MQNPGEGTPHQCTGTAGEISGESFGFEPWKAQKNAQRAL